MILTYHDVIVRLLVAGAVGGLIGFEREMQQQPAGLRTHIILVLGAALAMCISINLSMQFHGVATNGDPTRLAAQVISGIGFLGAGAIFRFGAGYLFIGVLTAIIVLFVLEGLDLLEKKLLHRRVTRTIMIKGADRPGFVQEVKTALAAFDIPLESVSLVKNITNNEIQIDTLAKILPDHNLDALVGTMSKMEGLSEFRLQ